MLKRLLRRGKCKEDMKDTSEPTKDMCICIRNPNYTEGIKLKDDDGKVINKTSER